MLKLGGEKRYATFLFTDVRGFTSLSEKLEPEEVTEIMNKVLTIQSDTVKFYDGMVDKYIGDAMMSATKEVGVDILIGEETAKKCGFELKLLEPIKVKGKEKPLQIYTINHDRG